MPRVEVSLPDRIDAQLETLVEQQDEFVSRDEAAEELLEMGIRAYDTESSSGRDGGLDTDRMYGPEETNQGPGGFEEMGGTEPGDDTRRR